MIGDADIDDDGMGGCPPGIEIPTDEICGDVDSCRYDADNDIDGDVICGDVDSCRVDAARRPLWSNQHFGCNRKQKTLDETNKAIETDIRPI